MTRNQEIETATLQRQASRLVEREVQCCMSLIVATLAQGGETIEVTSRRHGALEREAMHFLCSQASALAAPVLDYESAAREAGFGLHVFGAVERVYRSARDGSYPTSSTWCWRNACEDHDIEPHELEVYEHWAVSQWLAEKLMAKGERVDTDFAELNVWARTTTGQAISADSVIEAIVAETDYASAV